MEEAETPAGADPIADVPAASAEPRLRRSVALVEEKLQEVFDLAERIAEEVRVDARREADRYLEERRREADRLFADRAGALAGLEESLATRAGRMREDLISMAAELDRTIDSIRSAGGAGRAIGVAAPASVSGPGAAHAAEEGKPGTGTSPNGPRAVAYPATRRVDAGPGTGGEGGSPPADALLRATQLAVAGRERDEIEATLRDELGVSDPASVLDTVLGTE